jgi:hypothetical protein
MIDKVKNFLTGLASLTVFLYAVGYIAEYTYARMLGTPMGQPLNEYYLFSGGTLIFSTLYAVYSTITRHFYYFIPLLIIIGAYLQYGAYIEKKNPPRIFISSIYIISIFILVLVLLVVVVPRFTATFTFTDFLLPYSESVSNNQPLQPYVFELKSWILNGGEENKKKLMDFYVLSIFLTVISAVALYSMIRQWKRWKTDKPEPTNRKPGPASIRKKFSPVFSQYLHQLPRHGFGLLIILMTVMTAVQIFTIPANYGILVKSNYYPEVKVVSNNAATSQGLELLENQDPEKQYKVWLLRENKDELLLYAAFGEKNKEDTVFKLLTIKKNLVDKMEIFDNSFIFKYK